MVHTCVLVLCNFIFIHVLSLILPRLLALSLVFLWDEVHKSNICSLLVLYIHTFHTIWLIRNWVCFHNAIVTLHAAKAKILTMVAMSWTNSKGFFLLIVSDIHLLDNFMVSPGFRHIKEIEMVVWKSPTSPWIKVNIGGSLLHSHVACGGIFLGP